MENSMDAGRVPRQADYEFRMNYRTWCECSFYLILALHFLTVPGKVYCFYADFTSDTPLNATTSEVFRVVAEVDRMLMGLENSWWLLYWLWKVFRIVFAVINDQDHLVKDCWEFDPAWKIFSSYLITLLTFTHADRALVHSQAASVGAVMMFYAGTWLFHGILEKKFPYIRNDAIKFTEDFQPWFERLQTLFLEPLLPPILDQFIVDLLNQWNDQMRFRRLAFPI